jgi:hypothetical protein
MVDFMAEQPANPLYKIGPQAQSALGISDPIAGMNSAFKARDEDISKLRGKEQAAQTGYEKARETPRQAIQTEMEATKKTNEIGPEHKDIADAPKFSRTEIQGTVGVLMALAAFSGMASRQPLTASLNAMAGMMEGLNKGDQQRFENAYKEWDGNTKKVIDQNKQYLDKFNRIMKNHDLSIQQQQEQMRQLDVEYGHKLGLFQHERMDINQRVKDYETMTRITGQLENTREQIKARKEAQEQNYLLRKQMIQQRQEQFERRQSETERRNLALEELKSKAAAQGGKPTATERQHYVDSNQMLKSIDRVESMLNDPETRKKIDDSRVANFLSDSVETKSIQQFLIRPNIDPAVKNYLAEVANLRNQYYLDMSGKAVTGGEALRNYGAVVQPQDSADDVLNKMQIAKTRASEKMKDMETYFPSLSIIRGGEKSAARSFSSEAEAEKAGLNEGDRVIINGISGTWKK